MSKSCYFLSSLPTLSFNQEAPMSQEEFEYRVQNNIPEEDIPLLFSATLTPTEFDAHHPVLQKWFEFEVSLRNELVKARANLQNKDPNEFVVRDNTGSDNTVRAGLPEIVKSALSMSPYNMEIALLEYRFKFLEELDIAKFFDLDNLLTYYLRLQILLRKDFITSIQKGKEKYEVIYKDIYENVAKSIKL